MAKRKAKQQLSEPLKSIGNLVHVDFGAQLAEDYVAYSKHVIENRALPFVLDGLKPSQRRVLWAMWELGLKHNAKFMKSARVTGEVMGKYHPHSSQYGTLVGIAQPHAMRYPLADGQGNWGDLSNGPAAERYTEVRLTKFAEDLYFGLFSEELCDMQPNYDNTLSEPVFLPARMPSALLNDTSGIAVGVACAHTSYNVTELAKVVKAVLTGKKPQVLTPDLSSGAIVHTSTTDYAKGHGSFTTFANLTYEQETNSLIASCFPQGVSAEKLINETVSAKRDDKLPELLDVRDESDREGTRFVWELRPGANWRLFRSKLRRYTSCRKTESVNANVVTENALSVQSVAMASMGVEEIVRTWADWRVNYEVRRLAMLSRKLSHEILILDGLLWLYDKLDKIITHIREHGNLKPFVEAGQLTNEQAKAILAIPLRQLYKLEEAELKTNRDKLAAELVRMQSLDAKDSVLADVAAFVKEHGDARRSPVLASLTEFEEEDQLQLAAVQAVHAEQVQVFWAGGDIWTVPIGKRNPKLPDEAKSLGSVYADQRVVVIFDNSQAIAMKAGAIHAASGKREHRIRSICKLPIEPGAKPIYAHASKEGEAKFELAFISADGTGKRTDNHAVAHVKLSGGSTFGMRQLAAVIRLNSPQQLNVELKLNGVAQTLVVPTDKLPGRARNAPGKSFLDRKLAGATVTKVTLTRRDTL